MKTIAITLLLALAVPAAGAREQSDYRPSAREMRALEGQYDLDGGGIAQVYKRGGRYYYQVGGASRVEIKAVAPYEFVGVTLPVILHFNALQNGVVTGFTMRQKDVQQP